MGPQPAWQVDTADDAITVSTADDDEGDGLSIVRAVAHAVWSSHRDGQSVAVEAGDDAAREALQRWSLA